MCDYWLSKEFLDSSELRKKNRNISTFVPHTSGSIPYAIRREQEKNRLHRPPTQYELYKQTHMRKKKGSKEKVWVCDEAKRKLDDYERRLLAKHGDTGKPVHELDDPNLQLWQETVGGMKKGRLVGRLREKWSSRRGSFCPSFVADETSIKLKKMKSYSSYLHQYAKDMAETLALDPPIDLDDLFASSNASADIPTNNSTTRTENVDANDDDSEEDSMETFG